MIPSWDSHVDRNRSRISGTIALEFAKKPVAERKELEINLGRNKAQKRDRL